MSNMFRARRTSSHLDQEQQTRQAYFSRFITSSHKGLEIGPLTRPTFPKADGWNVDCLDHADTDSLKKKYEDTPAIDVEKIEAIDWVWSGGSYHEIPGIPRDFDFIVSCHSIEHSVDVVQFLADMAALLNDQGKLFLVVPSRSLMFDYYRPLSTLGDVLMGHLYPQALDTKARIDELYLAASLGNDICWTEEDAILSRLTGRVPRPIRAPEDIATHLSGFGEWAEETEYRDGHRWVFERDSLTDIVNRLRDLGLCEFLPIDHRAGVNCEFMMVLSKAQGPQEPGLGSYRRSLSLNRPAMKHPSHALLLPVLGVRAFAVVALRLARKFGGRLNRLVRRIKG